jgi:hypothetical protein
MTIWSDFSSMTIEKPLWKRLQQGCLGPYFVLFTYHIHPMTSAYQERCEHFAKFVEDMNVRDYLKPWKQSRDCQA